MLYHERWEQELVYDHRRPSNPRERPSRRGLRSETPAGVIQEVYALAVGHFVTRALIFEAATTVGLDTDRLSFLGCLQILKCRLPECDSSTPGRFEQWYRGLLWEMQLEPRTIRWRRDRSIPGWSSKRCRNIRRNDPTSPRAASEENLC